MDCFNNVSNSHFACLHRPDVEGNVTNLLSKQSLFAVLCSPLWLMFVFTLSLFPSSKVTQLFRCASYNQLNRQAEYIDNEMMSMKSKYNLMAGNEHNINVN